MSKLRFFLNSRNYILRWNKLAPTLKNKYADMSLLKSWQIQEEILQAYTAELEKQREENKKDRLAEQKNTDEQIERVRKKYYGTDKWMKAPNGNDTNLTERQWLQVRTENFKKWFGDWELLYTLKEVFNGDTVAELTGTEFSKIEGESLVDRVVEYYNSIGGKVERDGLGSVILSKKNVQSSIAHGIGRNKAIAFKAVPDVIKNGTITSRTENYKGRGYTSYVIDAPISISGERYICEVVIKESKTSKNFYLHEVEKIRLQPDNQVRASEENSTSHNVEAKASKLIIGKLWDEVNGKTSLVVDENGEPLVVYHGARTDQKFTAFGNKANFFTDNREVAQMFAAEYAYRLIVDGEEYALDNMSARSIAEAIEPVDVDTIMKSFDVGIDNILDDLVTTKELDNLVDIGGIQIGIDSFDGAEEISILPPSNKIFEVFLDIKNPQTIDFEGRFWEVGDDEKLTPKVGYDGVIARNIIEGGLATELEILSTDYVVSNAEQIKSATDNNGDFSIDNPDIRYQDSTEVQPREGTGSDSNSIASSYRFDTDKGKYYITDEVQREVFQVVSATMPNATEEQLSDLRKRAVFATAFLTSLDEDIQTSQYESLSGAMVSITTLVHLSLLASISGPITLQELTFRANLNNLFVLIISSPCLVFASTQ